MKNHAILMVCHKQPNLFARTVKLMEDKNHYFFVHVNQLVDIKPFIEVAKDLERVQFVKREKVCHGRLSQLQAQLNLFEAAAQFEKDYKMKFDYTHIISGQDYPLRSNEQFDSFFDNTNANYLLFDTEEQMKKNAKHIKINLCGYHLNNHSLLAKVFHVLVTWPQSFLFPRQEIKGLWLGWDFPTLNNKAYHYLLDYVNSHPKLLKRFDHTSSPTEAFYCTIFLPKIKEFNIEKNTPLRFASWFPRHDVETTYRPYNLDDRDYNIVINSKSFWARKVDEVQSAKLLDMIDNQRGSYYDINEHDYCM